MPASTAISRLAYTMGEPAGIGADLILALAQRSLPAEVVVVGSSALLTDRAKQLNLAIDLYAFDPNKPAIANGNGRLAISAIELQAPCIPGELNVANSAYVLATLERSVALCLDKTCQAMVTGPVHKAIIHDSGVNFLGHTEFLANLTNVPDVLMSFYSPSMIVALATTHCALHEVPAKITPNLLLSKIKLLQTGLKRIYQKPQARIRVCGLNPHAGENGLLGKEEIEVITPVIKECQQLGMQIHGPIPGDTAFGKAYSEPYDAILAMYHDQGLAPLKALHFGDIVNVTLGLPFLRTSVDHGTALVLAGSGKADASSLAKALQLAADLS